MKDSVLGCWVKCPCGHPACKLEYPTGLGTFRDGSGFDPEEKALMERAFAALAGAPDQATRIAELEAKNQQLADLAVKYKWQVRDTCSRAEKAEARLEQAVAGWGMLPTGFHSPRQIERWLCEDMSPVIDLIRDHLNTIKEHGNAE